MLTPPHLFLDAAVSIEGPPGAPSQQVEVGALPCGDTFLPPGVPCPFLAPAVKVKVPPLEPRRRLPGR